MAALRQTGSAWLLPERRSGHCAWNGPKRRAWPGPLPFRWSCTSLIFGTYQAGKKLDLWQRLHWPAWLQSPRMLTEIMKKQQALAMQPQQVQVPLMFVDVSPAQAVAEPPKNPKGYSDRNSLAANPEAAKITDMPKIDGKRPEVVRTVDVPREKFVPLQPAPPKQAAAAGAGRAEAQAGLHPGRPGHGQARPGAEEGRGRRERGQALPATDGRRRRWRSSPN